jgi:acyl-CoA synthetase (AMP-forming)/AMP-acid ligase II
MPSGAEPEHRRVDPLPEDVALVLHSSGSTGSPRGIPRTHRNLLAAVAVYPAWTGQEALARVLVTTPLSFGMGAHALCATLFAGGTAILPGTAPERILRAIQRWRPTWGYIVSSLLEAIVAAAERSDTTAVADWRTIGMSGMAPVSGLDERVQARLGAPFAEAYGCGEAGLIAAATRGGAVSELDRIFSAGVMTVDEAGESTAPGTPGEIVVWGEQVSRAYLGDPAATAIAFDREGRFHTGDIGVLDGFGALRLIGRTKEIINRGGEKLAPAEIDAVLHAHPAVAAAAAFPVPDSRLGEEVGAAVVLHRGATATERELRRFAARRLAPAKVPRRIWIVDALPRTGSGKVRRLELALRLREARAG